MNQFDALRAVRNPRHPFQFRSLALRHLRRSTNDSITKPTFATIATQLPNHSKEQTNMPARYVPAVGDRITLSAQTAKNAGVGYRVFTQATFYVHEVPE